MCRVQFCLHNALHLIQLTGLQLHTAISGGNKHMCVFYQTCVEKSQHLSVGFSDTYLVISTHVCNKTHQCGKSHIAALCVEVGFTKQVW